jgi:hypothetical protein
MTPAGKCCDRAQAIAWGLGILGTFLLMAVLVGALYRYALPEPIAAVRAKERYQFLADQKAAEAKALTEYAWQDQAREIVRLPVPRAIELTLQEWQNPAAARTNLIARVEKATVVAPPPPAAPNPYE